MTIRSSRASYLERKGSTMKKLLAASALSALLAIPALTGSPASAAVEGPQTIEAFLGSDLVGLYGYPAGEQVKLEVIRNGVVVGTATKTADATGFIEINHGGAAAGDCFDGPVTPDIMAGDTLQTTVLTGASAGEVDSEVARDVGINFQTIRTDTTANTITISGHARTLAEAPINAGDVLELRLNKGNRDNTWETGPGLDQDREGRRDLRVDIGANLDANGDFTRVLHVSHDDAVDWAANPGEVALEWSAAAAAGEAEVLPPAIFVADEAGGEAIDGCPPLARYAMTSSGAHTFVNLRNVGQDMVVGGVAYNATGVNVSIAGGAPHAATLSAVDGQQTWTATIPASELAALPQGRFVVSATFEGPGAPTASSTLGILKDTIAPKVPTATPKAGTYARAQLVSLEAQARTKIYFTQNGTRPTVNSRQFVRPIRVTASQTIKAISVDRAGNPSAVASFRYVIR